MSTVVCYRLNDHLYPINETPAMTLNADACLIIVLKKQRCLPDTMLMAQHVKGYGRWQTVFSERRYS